MLSISVERLKIPSSYGQKSEFAHQEPQYSSDLAPLMKCESARAAKPRGRFRISGGRGGTTSPHKKNYSPSEMAPAGQLSMHARHSTQASASITATPSSLTLMASAGHPASHEPHPTQTLVSTTGFAILLLLQTA